MIQLATRAEPADSQGFRPAANDGKAGPFELRRRSGHSWPFISTATDQAGAQRTTHTANNDSGS